MTLTRSFERYDEQLRRQEAGDRLRERLAALAVVREFFEEWAWLGPGVFTGTDFSEYVLDTRTRWELLLQLLQRAGDRISVFLRGT